MRFSLPSTTKSSTLLKWQPFSVRGGEQKTSRYVGTVCQRTGDERFLDYVTDLRLMLLVQGDQHVIA